ncbi:hypothetical protein C2S51_004169 [Perilla frutescens var. frutescens]|nr:hypothetical protein C2S51_004169 [Perilla frutescens var. frutescens]
MMSGSLETHAAFFFFLCYAIASFKLCNCARNNSIVCPEIEKQSLLSFKKSLKDPKKQLFSWGSEVDCCKWRGVVCDDLTGHVQELHLRCNSPLPFQGLSGKINPSLLNLKHLSFLDLSQNFFNTTIPSFIGSFTAIEFLNLSNAGFYGKIPYSIGNLSNLRALDLNAYRYIFVDSHGNSRNVLDLDRLEWLLGLSELEFLKMDGVNLSKANNWPKVINSLPSLLQLHFKRCSLDHFMASLTHDNINATSLTLLDFSFNNFHSFSGLRWISQLRNLRSLDLSHNSFEGPIPTFSNATKLRYIDLSSNFLNSTIPDWLYLCKHLEFVSLRDNLLHGTISSAISNLISLEVLDLSLNQLSGKIPGEIAHLCRIKVLELDFNKLEGEISDSFGDMSECFLGVLNVLTMQNNKLSGNLTDDLSKFRNLQYLILSYNSFSGPIPISLGKLSSLLLLNLQANKLTGNLPESLGQLFNLEGLYISHNMLEGVVTESFFANLTKLEALSASWNRLSLDVRPNWIPPFQLGVLRLGNWNLGTGSLIPSWLDTQKNYIYELDLFNTGISGSIPSWLWGIELLDLSHNYLHGKIPYIHNRYLYLNSNKFNGSLPPVGDAAEEINLSDNLFSGGTSHFFCGVKNETKTVLNLDLGSNQLSGELPDCWMKWPSLKFLSLSNNNISGSIPNSIGFLADLLSLNLDGNKFSGQIPFTMHNCIKLLKIDLAHNDLDGDLPTWIHYLKILILRSNKFSGEIPSEICHLNSLQILDLSDNKLSGIIPSCVENFTAMATKRSLVEYGDRKSVYAYSDATGAFADSASVTTKGSELQYGSNLLPLVTIFDLSRNNLSGDIPKELTSLVELRSLNLSQNHLTGLIPDSIGDMKQLDSLDFSKNSLSGRIPSSLTMLSFLSHLNLSYNNLTGRIPEGTQLLGFDASSYIGNGDLCGLPLRRNCSDDVGWGNKRDDDDESGESEIELFYVFLFLGFAVGFSGVCTSLVLKESWREAYFGSLEWMWTKLTKPLTEPAGVAHE